MNTVRTVLQNGCTPLVAAALMSSFTAAGCLQDGASPGSSSLEETSAPSPDATHDDLQRLPDPGPTETRSGETGPDSETFEGPDASQWPDSFQDAEVSLPTVTACSTVDDCGPSTPCLVRTCVDGTCQATPQTGAPCDDNSLCTTEDRCTSAGLCSGFPKLCPPSADSCTDSGCNGNTGECVPIQAADGTPCDSNLALCDSAEKACTDGVCSCSCNASVTAVLGPPGKVPLTVAGSVVLNPKGTATSANGDPLPAFGPLTCATQWTPGGELAPQVTASPFDIQWTRPCANDVISALATSYDNAGGTYWAAKEAGVLVDYVFAIRDASGFSLHSHELNGLHVVYASACDAGEQTIVARANVSDLKQIQVSLANQDEFRVGTLQSAFGSASSVQIEDPYQWPNLMVPMDWVTLGSLQLTAPCGDPITDDVFGAAQLTSWYNGVPQDGEIVFRGVDGGVLAKLLLQDAKVATLGECIAGTRSVLVNAWMVLE